MLLGTYSPKLDDKGRVILPAKFRDQLGSGMVLTRGQERGIYVFSAVECERVNERIRQAPMTSAGARDFLRLFLSGASRESPASQHRISVPSNLRDYAGLDRELTVIGVGDRAEIWNTETWNSYYDERESAFASQTEEVIPGIF